MGSGRTLTAVGVPWPGLPPVDNVWWGTQRGGHPTKDRRPTCAERNPQSGDTIWEQLQDQAEQTEGDHGEVRATYIMTCGVLVGVTGTRPRLVLC